MKISHLGSKISTGLLTAGAFFATAGSVHAQIDFGNITAPKPYQGSITTLITRIVNTGLIVIGIIAIVYLIVGGVTYITAGGDAEKAGKGRVAITNAIIGIIIIIAALAIYNAVVNAGSGQLT